MPREAKSFTAEEIETVRRMTKEGWPRTEIAEAVGITTPALVWYMRTNRFGLLPKGQGRKWRPLKRGDDVETGMLFGVPETEWRERQQKVKDSWPPEEMERRARQEVPNRADNYSEFKKNNPNIKPNNSNKTEKIKWPRKF